VPRHSRSSDIGGVGLSLQGGDRRQFASAAAKSRVDQVEREGCRQQASPTSLRPVRYGRAQAENTLRPDGSSTIWAQQKSHAPPGSTAPKARPTVRLGMPLQFMCFDWVKRCFAVRH